MLWGVVPRNRTDHGQNGKEDLAMRPEPAQPRPPLATGANGWREIIQSGAEGGGADGVSLEHLIDLQRAQSQHASDPR